MKHADRCPEACRNVPVLEDLLHDELLQGGVPLIESVVKHLEQGRVLSILI